MKKVRELITPEQFRGLCNLTAAEFVKYIRPNHEVREYHPESPYCEENEYANGAFEVIDEDGGISVVLGFSELSLEDAYEDACASLLKEVEAPWPVGNI